MLQDFAAKNQVKVITLSIGGNDAGFADVLQDCLTAFLTGNPFRSDCKDQSAQKARVTPEARRALAEKITDALTNIKTAMKNAGYQTTDYQVIYQMPPAPMPEGKDMRYR